MKMKKQHGKVGISRNALIEMKDTTASDFKTARENKNETEIEDELAIPSFLILQSENIEKERTAEFVVNHDDND